MNRRGKNYIVRIEGKNLKLNESETGDAVANGFFCTRVILTCSETEARNEALERVTAELKNELGVTAGMGVTLSIYEVSEAPDVLVRCPPKGFTFYNSEVKAGKSTGASIIHSLWKAIFS